MGKYISFGKYNNLYKYIWFYLIVCTIYDYIYDDKFPNQVKFTIFEAKNYPPDIFVQQEFNYLGSFLLSILIYLYERKQLKGAEKQENAILKIFIKNSPLNQKPPSFFEIVIKIMPTACCSILSLQLINIFLNMGLIGLDYWVFDLFFIAYVNYLKFGKEIFFHKELAIIFRMISITFFYIITTYIYLFDNSFNYLYKKYVFLIPVGIIIYINISLLRNYSLCAIKWLLDYKYISIATFLLIYNFIGTIILLISCIISNCIKCVDKSIFNKIDLICKIKIEKDNNIIEYYYDNFSYFFKQLWREDKDIGLNIVYIILFIFKIILFFIKTLISILTIKHLNPEFFLCAYEIKYFITRLLELINAIIQNKQILLKIFRVLIEIFSTFGVLIYLELIELKFFKLDYNLKRNIELRSLDDIKHNHINTFDDESQSCNYEKIYN